MGNGNTRPQSGLARNTQTAETIGSSPYCSRPSKAVVTSGVQTPEPLSHNKKLSPRPSQQDDEGTTVGALANQAQPRLRFSASLERSLNSGKSSSGSRSALRSSSSWTSDQSSAFKSEGFPAAPTDGSLRHSPTLAASRCGNTFAANIRRESALNSYGCGAVTKYQGCVEEKQKLGSSNASQTTRCHRTVDSSSELRSARAVSSRSEVQLPVQAVTLYSAIHKNISKAEVSNRGGGNSEQGAENRTRRTHLAINCEQPAFIRQVSPATRGLGRDSGSRLPMVECWEREERPVGRNDEGGKMSRPRVGRGGPDHDAGVPGTNNVTENDKPPTAESRTRRTAYRAASGGRTGTVRTRSVTSGTAHAEKAQGCQGVSNSRASDYSRGDMLTLVDKDGDRHRDSRSPSRTAENTRDCEESLSTSSASGSVVAPELSVCSLPPMGTITTDTIGSDMILEDSSFEDSGASVSLASSSDKNAAEGGGACLGSDEHRVGGREGRIGQVPSRHRHSSADAFVRTRSAGRGLSSLMGRIREQEERDMSGRSTNERTHVADRVSRNTEKERSSREKNTSDSDDGALSSVFAATSASSPASSSWTAPGATPSVNLGGHQRAALELRNLTLEREVEQLKAHLRNMGGGSESTVDRRRGKPSRRPRPRLYHLGDRVSDVSVAAGNIPPERTAELVAGQRGPGRRGTAPVAALSTQRRSSVSPTSAVVDETPKGPSYRRVGGDHSKSGDDFCRTTFGSVLSGRDRSPEQLSHVRGSGSESTATATGQSASRNSAYGHILSKQETTPAPSPPRRRASAAASVTTTNFEIGNPDSPARRLRNARLRSPESVPEAARRKEAEPLRLTATGPPSQPHRGGGLRAKGDAGRGPGEHGVETAVHEAQSGDSVRVEDVSGCNVGCDQSWAMVEARPLPLLRVEESRRRRGSSEKSRTGNAPIGLGGMVSGIKHSLLGRRRSTGGLKIQAAAPSRSIRQRTRHPNSGGGRCGGRNAHNKTSPLPLHQREPNSPTGISHIKGIVVNEAEQVAETPGSKASTTNPGVSSCRQKDGTASDFNEDEKKPPLSSSYAPYREASTTSASSEKEVAKMTTVEGDSGQRWGTRSGSSTSANITNKNRIAIGASVPDVSALLAASTRAEHSPIRVDNFAKVPSVTPGTTLAAKLVSSSDLVAKAPEDHCVGRERSAAQEGTVPLPEHGRWPATLDARWAEVEFVLCRAVESEESLRYTTEATEAGLIFMGKLEQKAQELGVSKGQLSRWLLPYNAETSVEEQQAATPRRLQEALQKSAAASTSTGERITLTEEEAEYLTAGARRVRQLIRLKIADDNDINTAKEALATMAGFFVSIEEEAARRGGTATAFGILQERRARSPIVRPPPLANIPSPPPPAATAVVNVTVKDSEKTSPPRRDHSVDTMTVVPRGPHTQLADRGHQRDSDRIIPGTVGDSHGNRNEEQKSSAGPSSSRGEFFPRATTTEKAFATTATLSTSDSSSVKSTVPEDQRNDTKEPTNKAVTTVVKAPQQRSSDRSLERSSDQPPTVTSAATDVGNRRAGRGQRAAPVRSNKGGAGTVVRSSAGGGTIALGGRGSIPIARGIPSTARTENGISSANGAEATSVARRKSPRVGVSMEANAGLGEALAVGGAAPLGSLERLKQRRRQTTRTARRRSQR